MIENLIAALKRDTAAAMRTWAGQMWDGNDPAPDNALADQLAALMLLAALNETGGKGDDVLEAYTDGVPVERYVIPIEDRAFSTVFNEALRLLSAKNPILTVMSPRELDPFTRQTAFFVSSVMQGNLVQKIKDHLFDIRLKGGTRSDFLQRVKDVATLSAPHMETVFRTNVMSAAGAARREQFNDPDVADLFVAYRYVAKADARGHPYQGTRPLHAAMNGFLAVKDDPIWRIVWTPCGYNCRCQIRGVRKHQGVEAGLMDESGRILTPRVYATSFQRQVVAAAEADSAVDVGGNLLRFPDEGFRGNALGLPV